MEDTLGGYVRDANAFRNHPGWACRKGERGDHDCTGGSDAFAVCQAQKPGNALRRRRHRAKRKMGASAAVPAPIAEILQGLIPAISVLLPKITARILS